MQKLEKNSAFLDDLREKKLLIAAWACENRNYASYQTWYSAFRVMINNIVFFDPQKKINQHGQKKMNEMFLDVIKKEKPDYIFFWLIYDEFYFDTLIKIREISPKTRLINFFGDEDVLFESFTRNYAKVFDYCLVSTQLPEKIYRKNGIYNSMTTLGVNLDKFKNLNLKKIYDVGFIGMRKNDRYEIIKYLSDNKINIKVFGDGWDKYADIKNAWGGTPNNEDYIKITNQTKINLCLSKNFMGKNTTKGRFYEASACCSFSLVEEFSGYLDFFKKDKEIVMFKDKEELLKKIKFYLKNEREREKIAKASYRKITKRFNLYKDVKKMLLILRSRKPKNMQSIFGEKRKIGALSKSDMDLKKEDLFKKIKFYDYISFKFGDVNFVQYRDSFQISSLENSRKQISCCDYYLSSKKLGDYMLFSTFKATNYMKVKKFSSVLDFNQIIMKKKFFIDNIEEIRKCFYQGKITFIDEKNTEFVAVPLVRLNYGKIISKELFSKVFYAKFESILRKFYYSKSLSDLKFFFNLILESLKPRNRIIRNRIIELLKN